MERKEAERLQKMKSDSAAKETTKSTKGKPQTQIPSESIDTARH